MYPSESSVFMSAVVRELTGMICRVRGGEGSRDQVNVLKPKLVNVWNLLVDLN
jgi:hypothetical protein